MKKNIKTKTHNLYKIIFLFVVFLGIGYAFLEATLNINGDVTVEVPELNVYIKSLEHDEENTMGIVGTSSIIGNDKLEYDVTATIPIAHSLSEASDLTDSNFYLDYLTITNKGSKDAYISNIDLKIYDSDGNLTDLETNAFVLGCNDFQYEKKIATGEDIQMTVGISPILNPDFSGNQATYTFKVTFDFEKDLFSNDDWATIISNVHNNNIPDYYKVGATKPITLNIDLDGDGIAEEHTYNLRIANNSTPTECSNSNFSQTACGFVLEFVDIIANHKFNLTANPTSNGTGNKGGWEYSEMRTFVNNDIYNALPQEIKDSIINTTVISGHGQSDTNNFTTTDKLYLLSAKEIWNVDSSIDSAANQTRQIDYYANKGVSTNKKQAIEYAIFPFPQKNLELNWWTRTAYLTNDSHFHDSFAGQLDFGSAFSAYGVSPAFRIG